jgi:putative PIN family toxin of toxin-antitoxin system
MSEPSGQPRAVVDTNLFVSGTFFRRGDPYRVLMAWRAGRFALLVPGFQHAELVDVFSQPKFVGRYGLAVIDIDELFAGLAAAEPVVPVARMPLDVRDPRDAPILAAALGGADFLVNGDKDLLVLRDDPRLGGLRIVTASEFLEVLDGIAAEEDGRT